MQGLLSVSLSAILLLAWGSRGYCSESVSVRFTIPSGTRSFVIDISPSKDEKSVSIRYVARTDRDRVEIQKKFSGPILAKLRRIWGKSAFDISHWPNSSNCEFREHWRVLTQKNERVICRNPAQEKRLSDFLQAVQALLRK